MAKRTKRGVSLKPIIAQFNKTERAVERALEEARGLRAKRLDTKLRKLGKIESHVRAICRGFYV